MKKLKRINARITNDVAQKLEEITAVTDCCVSDIVMKAIEEYYQHSVAGKKVYDLIEKSGFIGCAQAKRNLSQAYKKEFQKVLERKHDNR